MTVESSGPEPTCRCPNCESIVPNAEFCGACGTHLSSGSASRTHAFAAHPHEHLLHPSIVSTLFPHLPHRHTAPFRLALLGGTCLLILLSVLGLTAPDIAVACSIVPVLYLLYLYEAEVYEDEPILVIGCTFVVGAVLAVPWALLTGNYITDTLVANATISTSVSRDIVAGIVLPLAAQVIMMVGPAIMLFRSRYAEALDGFSFGAASALGFMFVVNLINLWPQLQFGVTSSSPSVDGTLAILGRGLLVPFIAASTTGLLAGSLWARRGNRRSAPFAWSSNIAVTVLLVVLVWCLLGMINIFVTSTTIEVCIYAVVAIFLLLFVRVAIHHMLLTEAGDVTIGPEIACSHCHYLVPRMAFCPHCGVATRATPKHGPGRRLRGVADLA